MFRVGLFSLLLILGLVSSQLVPRAVGPSSVLMTSALRPLATSALAFIMIRVGFDFSIDKRRLRAYAYDYCVAMTAAAIPWIFCSLYLVFALAPRSLWSSFSLWQDMFLLSRFAAPTSAGVLFSMLAAAGLSGTWMFRKARILAVFDDVDTILVVTLLQMAMLGIVWQLGAVTVATVLLLWVAWRYLRAFRLPRTWPWMLCYAVLLASICEGLAHVGHALDPNVPIRLEVLLPAFVLGCTMAHPPNDETLHTSAEEQVGNAVTACFMFLVGASMPLIGADHVTTAISPSRTAALPAARDLPDLGVIGWHVLALTALSNLGKMFPALCYRREATRRERLALGISMFPRGEVGAGVLVISLGAGITGGALTVATLSLALNLICTGLFIVVVKWLLAGVFDRAGLPSNNSHSLLTFQGIRPPRDPTAPGDAERGS